MRLIVCVTMGVPRAEYAEGYFVTQQKGTVRVFRDGALVMTRSSEGALVADRPEIPDNPAFPIDREYVDVVPQDSTVYFLRRQVGVEFSETASADEIFAPVIAPPSM